MRVGHRSNAAIEVAEEFVYRSATFPRALQNCGHRGEHVLDAVIELGNEQFLVFFGPLLFSVVADDTEQTHWLALRIAHNGAFEGDPSHFASLRVVGRIYDPILGFTGAAGAQRVREGSIDAFAVVGMDE